MRQTGRQPHRRAVLAAFSLCAAIGLVTAVPAAAQAEEREIRSRFDLEAVQGLLAVQRLDGWLLYNNRDQNPIAQELVNPVGVQSRGWFYLIPAQGQPVALVHKAEASNFEGVPGKKITYTGYRDLKAGLREMLRGVKRVGMEYAPKSSIPSLSRVDGGTIDLVRAQGVDIESSAGLVQFTKSLWGPAGRISHYVAAHHLDRLRKDALRFVARHVASGKKVTEHDVQQHILRGYKIRGIVGPPPVVASGPNTADPQYVPEAGSARAIEKGDLLQVELWAKLAGPERAIVADISWVAYVGTEVPEHYTKAFAAVAEARDTAISYIVDRTNRRRAIKGFEPDQQARRVLAAAGFADQFVHRTGHSLDTDVHGDGANLDDYETHDTRNLVRGSGFTVGPGVYVKGQYGVRSEVCVYIGPSGVELTTPAQTEITAILAK